jgi:hypothetical protein
MKGDDVKLRAGACDGYMAKPIDVATFGQKVLAEKSAHTDVVGPLTTPLRLPCRGPHVIPSTSDLGPWTRTSAFQFEVGHERPHEGD